MLVEISHRSPWGKFSEGSKHHLAHHCADVAACFEAMSGLPVFRARLQQAAGDVVLSETILARLAVLVFLHDVGKLHPGFQAKAWPPGHWQGNLHGHVKEGLEIFLSSKTESAAHHLALDALNSWVVTLDLLLPVFAHHGRPFSSDGNVCNDWRVCSSLGYDPTQAAAGIGALLPLWFPRAFVEAADPLPTSAAFQHLFCGLITLADWLGSTQKFFPYVAELDHDYMEKARQRAHQVMGYVGLDVQDLQKQIIGKTSFCNLTGMPHPRIQQQLVGEFPLKEQLVILEAETGSGKTEAALWRFVQLFEAGLVDSLYFALPTRAAAIQLQGRIDKALKRLFGETAPETVLTVPGYVRAGEVEGKKLPGWEVLWDDDDKVEEQKLLSRWAAESTKRNLAATISVGTVDQAMLAAVMVKHAHLRSAALSRSFLVIDEVHASDSYMRAIQGHLLDIHLKRGGYAMLMSATLGSVAREQWRGNRKALSFEEAVAAPYPAVWGQTIVRNAAEQESKQKQVTMTLLPDMAAATAATEAIAAAQAGARVLVIRNTVTAAIETFEAVCAVGHDDLLLKVNTHATLHHSRFAPEDRKLLDQAVEIALSPQADKRCKQGVIIIGTQTVEQSLDIDADILITDLCPVDVLLQRIGRLHRHPLGRPAGFEAAQCRVMTPQNGLERLLAPAFDNGLGMFKDGGGIYQDLPIIELTRQLIEEYPIWTIPAMNRFLVESATHPEQIEVLHQKLGKKWQVYTNTTYGQRISETMSGKRIGLPVEKPFLDGDIPLLFPPDEESIRTRLGAEGGRLIFTQPIPGPFGELVSSLTLPAHWSRGVDTSEKVTPVMENGELSFNIKEINFSYSQKGLHKAMV